MFMPSDLPMAPKKASLPCMEFMHNLCLYLGASQVNKAKKEGRPWECIITGENFIVSTWGEREEG
jgi:hypothetical protein